MVSFLHAIILGIIQGITEWLPISSSGHLVLFQHFFNIEPPVLFDIILHIGSLIVIFIVFWKDIRNLFWGVLERDKESLKFLLYLVIASIPIALVGFLLNDWVKAVFNDLRTVGFSLLFTSVLLFLSRYPKAKLKKLNFGNTLIIGIAQAFAILPGVSRSGSTISLGLMQGVKRKQVATFSFLMFIPAILGATILEIGDVSQVSNIPALVAGTLTAVIVGLISLKLLLKIIRKDKFRYFGWYCLALGLVTLFLAYF
jgi:undecaprenyl-diphosphatase